MARVAAAARTLSVAAAAGLLMAMFAASSLVEPVAASRDVDALAALRKGLQDPGGALASWDTSLVNPCTWLLVTCDGNSRVTRLDLGNQGLSGPMAPELGQLDQLRYLEIYGNSINGRIPSELGGLENLVGLDLHGNRISGPVPMAIGNLKSLKFLDLSSNDLCGTIPTGGALKDIPASSFANNPRLHQRGNYEPNC